MEAKSHEEIESVTLEFHKEEKKNKEGEETHNITNTHEFFFKTKKKQKHLQKKKKNQP